MRKTLVSLMVGLAIILGCSTEAQTGPLGKIKSKAKSTAGAVKDTAQKGTDKAQDTAKKVGDKAKPKAQQVDKAAKTQVQGLSDVFGKITE